MTAKTIDTAALTLRLDRGRWWLLRDQPFYGTLAMGLRDVLDPHVPTACTNGRVIRWNPDFLGKLTEEETRFVLMHETMHCAHGHMWRFKMSPKANCACDYGVNLSLSKIEGVSMPKGGLIDPQYEGMAEEEIYAILPEFQTFTIKIGKAGEPQDQDGQDPGGCGAFEEPAGEEGEGQSGNGKPGTTAEGEEADKDNVPSPESLRDEWERRIIQAVQAAEAQGRGDVPADMRRHLERVKHQPIDWRQELADFVKEAAGQRNDWSRSARRHAWQNVIYPRKKARDDIGLVLFWRDSSGSISLEQLGEFTSLIESCLAETGARGLIVDCDCEIHSERWIEPGDPLPWDADGGGGSDATQVFLRAGQLGEEGERIAGIVCLTDGEISLPEPESVGYNTLWLLTQPRIMPFGRSVSIER